MDPNYANAGGGGGVGVGVGIGIVPSAATGGVVGSGTTVPTASAIPSGRYNTAFYKDSLAASCQRGAVVPPPYNTYDPYGSSGKVSSAYPYDAEAEFKERTGMGKTTTKVMAGNVVIPLNSAKVQHQQHAYSQNSCYSGSYSQSNAPESANYYAAAYAYEQQQQQQHHHYTQQQQQQYHHHQHHHHQSQLQQQYKYNKLVAAQQQQHQQQQHHQHSQQQKIPPPEYGYASYHHPYYHPHYHHPSSSSSSSAQKGVTMMKTIPDAGSSSSSMPYGSSSSKMMTARAPQYPTNYNAFHHHPPQSSYPPVVTAGHQHQHQHTYQSQNVCEDSSRWMWNSSSNSSGNEYPNSSSCRSGGTYSAYVNGTSTAAAVAAAAAAKQHNTMWPSSHSMPMQYQTTGYPAAAAMASNQSCCPPPPPHHPSQSSTTTFYPQQYVKYPIHQNAVVYNNDLYGNSPQSNPSSTTAGGVVAGVTASGKVYTDLSGNSYQQAINNNPVAAFHHHHHQQQQQQTGEYSSSHSSTVDYNSPRYLQQQHHHHHHQQQQQQHQTESPSSLSSGSSSTSSYNHHYYHPYPGYSNAAEAAAHQESYQQQVDTKIKSQSLRDFLTSWNEDEDEMNAATEVPFMEQMHLNSDHFAQDNNGGAPPPVMENHLQFKGSFSSTSRPKIHVGITVDSTVESDQYINLPDIIIDIEKSNKDIVSLNDDCHVANIPPTMTTKLEKDDVLIKEEMPNVKENDGGNDDGEENIEEEAEKYPKKLRNQSIQREKKSISSLSVSSMRRKCQNSKRFRITKQRFTVRRHHRKLKIVRRKFIRRRVKKQPKQPTFNNTSGSNNILQQYNPQSLKCLCVSLINSEKFRKRVLGPRSDIVNLLNNNNNKNTNNNSNIITTVVDNEVNVPLLSSTSDSNCTTSNSSSTSTSSTSVIPKLSDLCKNALNSSFDRDVLVINLDEILDSDNLFVVQCDINENILENFVDESVQLQQQQEEEQQQEQESSSSSNNSNKIINVNDDDREEEAEDLVEILNDNNNNYNNNNNSGSSSENNNQDIQFTTISNDIEQQHLKRRRCCSRSRSHSPTTEVSNLPLDNSVEHNNNFNLSSINPLIQPPLPSSPPPPSLLTPPPLPSSPPPPSPPLSPLEVTATADGSISCPTAAKATKLLYDDGRGHDRHSHSSSSSLIEQNCLTQQQISISSPNNNKNSNKNNQNDENDNNQQLHEMFDGIVPQQDTKKDNVKTFLSTTTTTSTNAIVTFDDSTSSNSCSELLLESSKVVTTPSIHHEEIVPDNLKKFQNEKFLKYLHAKYVQGNLSEFYHANRIIKKYKKRIIKKLLNIVR